MTEVKKEWYVLRAVSGKEAKVKEVLDASIKNTDLGKSVSQVLIPTQKVYTTRNGKKVLKERNLYPGYVFVELMLHPVRKVDEKTKTEKIEYRISGEAMYELRNTTNVIDFLRGRAKNSEPMALRDSEVKRMLGNADEMEETVSDTVETYIVGETVKVTYGPFNGFTGTVKEVNNERKKIVVEVKIFGRGNDLTLEVSQVEKV